MYINGESVASGNITVSMSSLASSAANYIAKSQYTSDPNYTGCIDEMEIYNDTRRNYNTNAGYCGRS